jgi:hypothetical protein
VFLAVGKSNRGERRNSRSVSAIRFDEEREREEKSTGAKVEGWVSFFPRIKTTQKAFERVALLS